MNTFSVLLVEEVRVVREMLATLINAQPDLHVVGQIHDPRAIPSAEKAHELAPTDPRILDTLGTLHVEKGDPARGVELLRKAVELSPGAPSVRLHLAQGLIKLGEKQAARRQLDELAKLGDQFPGQPDVARLRKEL